MFGQVKKQAMAWLAFLHGIGICEVRLLTKEVFEGRRFDPWEGHEFF